MHYCPQQIKHEAALAGKSLTKTYLKGSRFNSETNWQAASSNNTICLDGAKRNTPINSTCGFYRLRMIYFSPGRCRVYIAFVETTLLVAIDTGLGKEIDTTEYPLTFLVQWPNTKRPNPSHLAAPWLLLV